MRAKQRWVMCVSVPLLLSMTVASRDAAGVSDDWIYRPHLVAVESGQKFNLVCAGPGPRTIVLLQGAGSQMGSWEKILPRVRAIGRVCLYDRPGYGFSDPARRPMTLNSVSDDLHALLKTAHVMPPFLLVGHSLGGWYAVQYANRFPRDVAGMVLVDPAFSGVYEFPRSKRDTFAFARLIHATFDQVLKCRELALQGELSTSDPKGCVEIKADLSPEKNAAAARYLLPAYYDAALLELQSTVSVGEAVPTDEEQDRTAATNFGAMPLIVLTAAKSTSLPGMSAEGNHAFRDRWQSGHRAIAARSRHGVNKVVPNADHFIQLDQPDAVIDAISEVARLSDRERP